MNAAAQTNQADWIAEFPPPRSLPLDQEALRIYERAYAIGLITETTSEPPITFSTVAIALLLGQDETSRWFAQEALTKGPDPVKVFAEKQIPLGGAPAIPSAGRPKDLRLSTDKQLLTLSAQALLGTAEEWANRVGASDIGVRHLVASYVLNPPAAHRRQMNNWAFKERAWRDDFFIWIAQRYTAESWNDVSGKVSPTKAIASFERPTVKGAALAFPGDEQAMQVLARAAQYHAQRSDPWLRLQTVLFALIELTHEDIGLQQTLAPLWKAATAQYHAARDVFLRESAAAKPLLPFDALDISPRVLNGLETARELALAAGHDDGIVGVLALAAALISRRVDGDEDLGSWGFDPGTLRLAVIDLAVAKGESRETWREALGEEELLPTGRTMDLNSDEPEAVVRGDEKWASDPLGIRGDVAAFATLLASKSLEPPLSIGLFGPWGAGKTTFLKRLRLAIDARTAQAREAQPSPYVSHVVHVEFNAWHFAETALISSLVDTIVHALRAFIKNDNPPVGKALAELKSETVERSRLRLDSARQAEAEARNAVATAAKTQAENEAAARKRAVSLDAALQTAWAATLAAAKEIPVVKESRLLENLGDTVQSLEDLKARAAATRARPARMFAELGWFRTGLLAVLVLAVPVAVGWLVNRVLAIDSVNQAVVSLSAMLSVVVVWLRAASGAVSKIDAAITKVAEAYEAKIQADPKIAKARQELEAATVAAATAAEGLTAAEAALGQAEADLASASLPAQVMTLVQNRVDDRSYAKELTTISAARADLQLLSQLLREQSQGNALGNTPAGVTPVDRVILYIDDLDRCKPEDVVRVLQVVHMLLAFELFVVVVAVDARWVDESLKQTYRWLKGGKTETGTEPQNNDDPTPGDDTAHITPQDYLEKIFQISFWLEPMTAARAAEYLKSLIRTPRRESGGATPTGAQIPAGRIEILPIELDYMRALAAYVGPSPRRVKRLVNAYRLLKARISDAQLDQFLTDRTADDGSLRSGPYQLVIGLLVIGTGAPTSASEILTELAERDPRDRLEEVIDTFRARQNPDWTMAAQVLEMLMRTQKSNDISELRGWASKVGRFLLQGSAIVLRQNRGQTQRPQ